MDDNSSRAILAIDDDHMMVHLIEHVLSKAGFTVFATEVPEAALAIVARENIAAAVINVVMPLMDGTSSHGGFESGDRRCRWCSPAAMLPSFPD